MCRLQSGNIEFDTGYLDSHLDLGMNTPPRDRVQIRRKTTCAPLVTEGYTRTVKYDGSDANYTQYLYGPGGSDWDAGNAVSYEYPEFSREEFFRAPGIPPEKSAYTIGGLERRVKNSTTDRNNSSWEPIPALQNHEADTTLLFLSANWILFISEVDDPWYSAHRNVGDRQFIGVAAGEKWPLIPADEAAYPLACKVQQQYCNPNLPRESRCSRFSGIYDETLETDHLWTSKRQKQIHTWTAYLSAWSQDMLNTARSLGSASLTSRFALRGRFQGALPPNQWQLDAEFLHNTTLAELQSTAISYAQGPSDPRMRALSPAAHALCSHQKIRSPAHMNFSVFYLALIFCIGAIIIAISYALEPLVSCLQRRRNFNAFARLEWASNETLQLQRLAHEVVGGGEWRGCVDTVPVTADARERLAVLDVADREHPRLKRAGRGFEEVLAGKGEGESEREEG